MKAIPHPIQYQGSKRNLAAKILRYVPRGIDCLIEPFAGSGAVSIAGATHGVATSYLLNDLNRPLSELLRMITEHPTEIASAYEAIWNEQHTGPLLHYSKVREEFNLTQDPALFLYLLARCVKGSVRYNARGQFNQSPDKRRTGAKPSTMRSNIFGVSALLKGRTTFSALDYREVLREARRTDFIYLDPPYQGVCGNRDPRYLAGISYPEFIEALEALNNRNVSYIVSYDGRRGDKVFGQALPDHLGLTKVELEAGRSSQSTLLGRNEVTYESLYLSPGLSENKTLYLAQSNPRPIEQYTLFERVNNYA